MLYREILKLQTALQFLQQIDTNDVILYVIKLNKQFVVSKRIK